MRPSAFLMGHWDLPDKSGTPRVRGVSEAQRLRRGVDAAADDDAAEAARTGA